MRTLVVIPTYNESQNIGDLIPIIFHFNPEVDILVVDDNSPDGTGELVRTLVGRFSRLHLLSRPGKDGVAKAYINGFTWGLERGYSAIAQMDADFSHRSEDLRRLLAVLPQFDFVMGSRWVSGGKTLNWGIGRTLLSRCGSFYARQVLRVPVLDWTGGFNVWKAGTLAGLNLDSVRSRGYSFQIELKYRALKLGFRGQEVPIVFENRRFGQSKLSFGIAVEALWRVWGLRSHR